MEQAPQQAGLFLWKVRVRTAVAKAWPTRPPPVERGSGRCAAQAVPGVRIPPSPLQKAKNGGLRPGSGGRVFVSFGRVRWQFGGKLAGRERTEMDEMTPDGACTGPMSRHASRFTAGRAGATFDEAPAQTDVVVRELLHGGYWPKPYSRSLPWDPFVPVWPPLSSSARLWH